MLNKLWASLIILGILFALGQDIHDEVYNTYNNRVPQTYAFIYPADNPTKISLTIDGIELNADFSKPQQLSIYLDNNSPEKLQDIAQANGNSTQLDASVVTQNASQITLLLPELHWRKLRQVTKATFDMAEFAVKLALGLIGIMALWLGLMQVAEKSGLILSLVRQVQPAMRWLFPNIPKDHPAFGSISMNITANVLGLGNAATPLGIKAMQQLQSLNTNPKQASDDMCMFLALNTSSVQLLPPVTLIALMGTQVSELIVPIILATSCSTIVAISVAKLYSRHYRKQRKTT